MANPNPEVENKAAEQSKPVDQSQPSRPSHTENAGTEAVNEMMKGLRSSTSTTDSTTTNLDGEKKDIDGNPIEKPGEKGDQSPLGKLLSGQIDSSEVMSLIKNGMEDLGAQLGIFDGKGDLDLDGIYNPEQLAKGKGAASAERVGEGELKGAEDLPDAPEAPATGNPRDTFGATTGTEGEAAKNPHKKDSAGAENVIAAPEGDKLHEDPKLAKKASEITPSTDPPLAAGGGSNRAVAPPAPATSANPAPTATDAQPAPAPEQPVVAREVAQPATPPGDSNFNGATRLESVPRPVTEVPAAVPGFQTQDRKYDVAESQPPKQLEVATNDKGEMGVIGKDGKFRSNDDNRRALGDNFAPGTAGGEKLDKFLGSLKTDGERAQALANMADVRNNVKENGTAKDVASLDANTAKFIDRGGNGDKITPEQKATTLAEFANIARGDRIDGNNFNSGMDAKLVSKALSSGVDRVANPSDINQIKIGADGKPEITRDANGKVISDGTAQCNGSVVTEGLAHENPEKFAARLREITLHGTYTGNDGFKAVMPSGLMKPNSQQQFADSLFIGGQLNHHWQQRGQYFVGGDTQNGGYAEGRFSFDSSKVGTRENPFGDVYKGAGASVGANEVASMGINAGIDRGKNGDANFMYAKAEWLPTADEYGPLGAKDKIVTDGNGVRRVAGDGVAVITDKASLQAARLDRYEKTNGGDWGIAGVSSRDQKLFGGPGGAGGGHVISTYMDTTAKGPDGKLTGALSRVSDQYGTGSDKTVASGRVSDDILVGGMDFSRPTGGREGGNDGGSEGTPQWRERQPKTPGMSSPDELRHDRRSEAERAKDAEKEKDFKPKEGEDPRKDKKDTPPELNKAIGNRASLLNRLNIAMAQALKADIYNANWLTNEVQDMRSRLASAESDINRFSA